MLVGTTTTFTWLDARLTEEERNVAGRGAAAQISDGPQRRFYVVENEKVPDLACGRCHWFRWEAGTTWLSGIVLLILDLLPRARRPG